MSVLADGDRAIVAAAVARSRQPRRRLTRTQALAAYPRPAKVEKREPLLFVGLCSWCGGPAQFGSAACEAHTDLLDLDGHTSAVVTTPSTGRVGTPIPGRADAATKETH